MWSKIKPGKDPRGNGYGDGEDWALSRRCFGVNGKSWPRMVIAVYPNKYPRSDFGPSNPTGFNVEVSFKKRLNDYWQSHALAAFVPIEVYDDFLEMLEEAKNKIVTYG